MGNIVTYIKEQGNYALLEHPFNEIDNLIFSELSYLDLYGKKFTFFFGEAPSLYGPTANVDIYIDAAGASEILETYQNMGKICSRLVIVAVLAGNEKSIFLK